MSSRESIFIGLDPELALAIRVYARESNISFHDAARELLRLGIDVLNKHLAGEQLPLTSKARG